MRELSPDFDDEDFEKILEWGKAKVTCDYLKDDFPLWTLSWKPGFVSFWGISPEDEQSARKAAALFIHLWTRGIDAGLAERCGNAYAVHYKPRESKD